LENVAKISLPEGHTFCITVRTSAGLPAALQLSVASTLSRVRVCSK